MTSEHFSVSWDNFHKNMSLGMNSLFENEDFVDVTLAVEGRYLKAHKMVLSVCSSYFRELFKTSPCKHPIVFMKDVSYVAMNDLLQFMYHGEVQVCQENFAMFLKTAESLQIKGLSNYDNGLAGCANENLQDKTNPIQASQSLNLDSEKTHHRSPSPPPKRPRLNEKTQSSIVKTETEMATSSALFEEQLIQMKMEPYDQEQTSNGNLSDDPLDETFADETNEDYWMMEGADEESETGTSGDVVLVGEECESSTMVDVPEVMPMTEEAASASKSLSGKSFTRYEKEYQDFNLWRKNQNVEGVDEDILLSYLSELSTKFAPNSLWTKCSMLKACLKSNENVDISGYKKLFSFLKSQSEHYKPKKTVALTQQQITRFLLEAPDVHYLLQKVITLFGIFGGCRRDELVELPVDNIKDKGDFVLVTLKAIKNKSRKFMITEDNTPFKGLDLLRKYASLRPPDVQSRRFFLDYRNGKCTRQVVGKHKIGGVPKKIAEFLKLEHPEQYTGHGFRKMKNSSL